ncbi:MAG TPA: hypothetical protein VMI31_08700 [Fimbriimonadaceae bacterium]|nr:hypothetical protein [Fimbriimonadaceae bacterium]
MSASKAAAPAEKAEQYDRLVASIPEIERKGAANPYTAVNGNMFSYLHPSGLMALRLPESDRSQFLATYSSKLFEAYGIVQKEYVTVPEELLANTEELRPYLEKGFAYAKSLRPKPSRKA